jgi:hypothetical protein
VKKHGLFLVKKIDGWVKKHGISFHGWYIYIYIFNPLSLLLKHRPSPNGKHGDLFLSLGGILH